VSDPSDLDVLVSRALYEHLARHGGGQILLFGPEGKPHWAARVPLDEREQRAFRAALSGIKRLEKDHPKPFMSRHPNGDCVAAALDDREDLFVVLFADLPTEDLAETRIAAARADLAKAAERIRETSGSLA
jgi:hypothetical protein